MKKAQVGNTSIFRDVRSSCYSYFWPSGATKEHCVERIGAMEPFSSQVLAFRQLYFGYEHSLISQWKMQCAK